MKKLSGVGGEKKIDVVNATRIDQQYGQIGVEVKDELVLSAKIAHSLKQFVLYAMDSQLST